MLHYQRRIVFDRAKDEGERMTISEVSKKYGISQDTLRYYERVGVIPPVHRMKNGLRDYLAVSWV